MNKLIILIGIVMILSINIAYADHRIFVFKYDTFRTHIWIADSTFINDSIVVHNGGYIKLSFIRNRIYKTYYDAEFYYDSIKITLWNWTNPEDALIRPTFSRNPEDYVFYQGFNVSPECFAYYQEILRKRCNLTNETSYTVYESFNRVNTIRVG